MTYRIFTLGCKVNQQESETIALDFEKHGFSAVKKGESADIFVINSCTVTSIADSKTRQRIRQSRKANPKALVCVVGCLPEVARDVIEAMPEVDLVIGSLDKERTAEIIAARLLSDKTIWDVPCVLLEALINSENAAASTESSLDLLGSMLNKSPRISRLLAAQSGLRAARTRAFIKAEDGCDRFCAYCIVPYARGPVRSRAIEDVVSEAKGLLETGYKELVLTGVNLAMHDDLYGLARRICAIDTGGEYRVRLGSLEPNVIGADDAMRIAGIDGICPQFHLSLQSGAERTLKEMGRGYSPGDYAGIVNGLRGIDPLFSVTTDVIVGFPGESDDDFAESLDFVRNTGFARVHVFKYSKRPGTRAAEMSGQVPETVKNERSRKMIEVAEAGAAQFLKKNNGISRRTLIFGPDKNGRSMRGLTDNGIDVLLPCSAGVYNENTMVDIKL